MVSVWRIHILTLAYGMHRSWKLALCFLVHRPSKGKYKIRPKCTLPRGKTFLVSTSDESCGGGCSCLFFRRHLLVHQAEVREHVISRATDTGSIQQWTASCVSEASWLKKWFVNAVRPGSYNEWYSGVHLSICATSDSWKSLKIARAIFYKTFTCYERARINLQIKKVREIGLLPANH